ncbi:unnamed protein product, partial [Ectocarpus sp. 12 AP-2014]
RSLQQIPATARLTEGRALAGFCVASLSNTTTMPPATTSYPPFSSKRRAAAVAGRCRSGVIGPRRGAGLLATAHAALLAVLLVGLSPSGCRSFVVSPPIPGGSGFPASAKGGADSGHCSGGGGAASPRTTGGGDGGFRAVEG